MSGRADYEERRQARIDRLNSADELYKLATTPNSEFYGDRIERKTEQ